MPVRLAPSAVASCSGELGPSRRSWTRISRRRPDAPGGPATRALVTERELGEAWGCCSGMAARLALRLVCRRTGGMGRGGAVRSGDGPRPLARARPPPRDDPRLHGQGGRAGRRRARAGAALPGRHRQAPRRDGLARHPDPRGRGRRRPRHARLRDRDRGDRPRLGLARPDRRGPHQPRLRTAPPRRHTGAEGALPRPDGVRQGPRRLRPDRARRRQRRRRHADDGAPRGRPRRRLLGHRRRQALHHERRPGRDVHRHRPDGRDARRATPRSAPSSSRPTRPASASAGSRRSSASMRPRPAS